MGVILFNTIPLIVLKFQDRVDWCRPTLIAYRLSIHSNFENNVVIILPNRSVCSMQTRRTVIMKSHVPSGQRRCRETASQANMERIFSLCGLLTAGRRNRMSQNLDMRAFVKLNRTRLQHRRRSQLAEMLLDQNVMWLWKAPNWWCDSGGGISV